MFYFALSKLLHFIEIRLINHHSFRNSARSLVNNSIKVIYLNTVSLEEALLLQRIRARFVSVSS